MVKKFTVNEKEYEIRKPSAKDIQEAQRHYNKVYASGLKDPDLLTRDQMINLMKDRGIWDDNKEKEIENKRKELVKLQDKLDEGGIELSEAEKMAKKMLDLREEIVVEYTVVTNVLEHTIEQQAEVAKEDYLFFKSVYHKGKLYCKSFDDFYMKNNSDPVLVEGYIQYKDIKKNLASVYDDLPEVRFLKDYGFMNDDFSFVNGKEKKEEEKPKKKEKKPFLKDGKPVEVKEKVEA